MKKTRGERPSKHKPAADKREEYRGRNERPEPVRDRERANMPPPSGGIYGFSPVLERLRSKPKSINKIYALDNATEYRFREVTTLAREHGIVVERVGRDALMKLVGPDVNHQGIVAVASSADYAEADDLLGRITDQSLLLILDGVEDPRNFGAILRSAECAGVESVFIPERRAVGLTETVAKSSAGAIEYVPVARVQNINRLIEELKEKNVWVIGTSGDADTNYTDWDWTRPSALVLGNEGSGLHRLVAENCDMLVKIPMYGKIDSLNVSVAAGVVLFEARRQRSKQ